MEDSDRCSAEKSNLTGSRGALAKGAHHPATGHPGGTTRGRLGLIRPKHILYKVMKLGQSLITFLKRLYMAEAYWQLLRRDTVEIREDLAVRLHLGQNILPKAVPLVLHPLAFDVFCTSRDDDENGRGLERRINGFLKIRCTQFLEADIAHENTNVSSCQKFIQIRRHLRVMSWFAI